MISIKSITTAIENQLKDDIKTKRITKDEVLKQYDEFLDELVGRKAIDQEESNKIFDAFTKTL